jgi:hypothetical protein
MSSGNRSPNGTLRLRFSWETRDSHPESLACDSAFATADSRTDFALGLETPKEFNCFEVILQICSGLRSY